MEHQFKREPDSVWAATDPANTFLFKTASNRIGILKTSSLNESERSVTIRYKLVASLPSPSPDRWKRC